MYNSYAVSNSFLVKSLEDFENKLEELGLGIMLNKLEKENFVSLSCEDGIYGDDNVDEDDLYRLIQECMDDRCAVFVSQVGNGNLISLYATCTIITKDKIETKNLFDNICKEHECDIFY